MAVGGIAMQIPYRAIGGGHGATYTMSCKMGMQEQVASNGPNQNTVGQFGLPAQLPGGNFQLFEPQLIKTKCNVKYTMKRVNMNDASMGVPDIMQFTGVLLPR
jgi:hypothetical protein